jgi:hypothetical protein
MSKRVVLVALILSSSACGLAELQQRNASIEKSNADAVARMTEAQKLKRTDMYVVSESAWFCADAAAAAKRASCKDGQQLGKNETISVIGLQPEGETWKAAIWDSAGEHQGFIAAAAVNELPDTSALDQAAAAIEERYPAKKRIPSTNLNLEELLAQQKAYAGRYLLMRIGNSDMRDFNLDGDKLTFVMYVPSRPGSRQLAAVQFEFSSASWAKKFHGGKASYRCGAGYCDNLVVVASLSGVVDRVDDTGALRRLPVFAVRELADRFGSYKAE